MITFAICLALAYSGWSALSMGMDRHYADVHGRGAEPPAAIRARCRLAGALALSVTFAICVASDGWGIGPVYWMGTISMAALLIVAVLSYAPHWTVRSGQLAALLSLAGGLCWLLS